MDMVALNPRFAALAPLDAHELLDFAVILPKFPAQSCLSPFSMCIIRARVAHQKSISTDQSCFDTLQQILTAILFADARVLSSSFSPLLA